MTSRVSPKERIRSQIDELIANATTGSLLEQFEEMARLAVRLTMQTALEAEVTEFLGRDRYQRKERERAGSRSGSVAVNREGVRLGKGAGYSDIEVALLQEAGLIGPETVIVTTVHPLQVVDEPLPETEHDFSVDLIVTLDEVIECGPPRRPRGLLWEHLSPEKIGAIPVLAARSAAKRPWSTGS